MNRPIKITALLLSLLFALSLFGCSSRGGATLDTDADTAAQSILSNVDFQAGDSLTKADTGAAEAYYQIDDTIADYAIYINGAIVPAEEIAVLKTDDVEKARAIIDKRLRDLEFQFENYVPEELDKIQNPVIVTGDNVVIMILTGDAQNAEQVAEGLLK